MAEEIEQEVEVGPGLHLAARAVREAERASGARERLADADLVRRDFEADALALDHEPRALRPQHDLAHPRGAPVEEARPDHAASPRAREGDPRRRLGSRSPLPGPIAAEKPAPPASAARSRRRSRRAPRARPRRRSA